MSTIVSKTDYWFPVWGRGMGRGMFPRWLRGKESVANARDTGDGFFPGLGRSPGGRNDNLLHNSCLDYPMDREAWQAIVHEIAKSLMEMRCRGYEKTFLGEGCVHYIDYGMISKVYAYFETWQIVHFEICAIHCMPIM